MRIYVAGQWAKRAEIRKQMDIIEAKRDTITHDWTGHASSAEGAKTQQQFADEARADLAGIHSAEVFVAFMDSPTYQYRGTFFEMGYALGCGVPVYIITPYTEFDPKNVYFHSNTFTWSNTISMVKDLDAFYECVAV